MSPFNPLSNAVPNPLSLISARVQTWAIESQQGARRNAMIASTALAARRAERQDVDAYFASLRPAIRSAITAPTPRPKLPVAARR
jgi:hypothetical protein